MNNVVGVNRLTYGVAKQMGIAFTEEVLDCGIWGKVPVLNLKFTSERQARTYHKKINVNYNHYERRPA